MKFEKVSEKIFKEALSGNDAFCGKESSYDTIILPKRATSGSAGYDFYSPFDITLEAGQSVIIPTGIRAKIDEGYVLMIFPRSGLGFKYKIRLSNTVGIIDSDYYGSNNEGHIMIKLSNENTEGKTCEIKAGQGFAQGIFLPFGVTDDDDCDTVRNGGFGSTTK